MSSPTAPRSGGPKPAGGETCWLSTCILPHLSEGVFLVRAADGVIVYANPRFEEMFGYEAGKILGKHVSIVNAPGDRTPEERAAEIIGILERTGAWRGEIPNVKQDGTRFWCFASVRGFEHPEHGRVWASVHQDITERVELRRRLLQADCLTLLGTLAGGVGHEINNPLAVIVANLDQACSELRRVAAPRRTALLAELVDQLDDARTAAARIGGIVKGLRTLAHGDDGARGPVELRPAVELALQLVAPEIRSRGKVVVTLATLPPVMGNVVALAQVVVHLLVNAARSLPEATPAAGEIQLCTRLAADGRAALEVHHTGPGLDAHARERLFEPFFAAEAAGAGALAPAQDGGSLGLAICHGIVTKLGGTIEVDSEPGAGTTLRVLLPVAPVPRSEPPVERPSEHAPRSRVLVIDDESLVAASIRRALSRDHQVVVETDARVALEHIRRGERFDAIVCDLMMPGMTGVDFYLELGRTEPRLARRVLFVTGGAVTPRIRELVDASSCPVIQKPFDIRNLRAVVAAAVADRLADTFAGADPAASP